jgi:hypothetical protein
MSALRDKVDPLDVLSRRGVLPGLLVPKILQVLGSVAFKADLDAVMGYAEAMNAAEAVSCGLDGAVVLSAK